MGMPVKLSDKLVKEARRGARTSGRSITGQIEHWATIGRSAERSLPLAAVEDLKGGKAVPTPHHVVSFFEQVSQALMQAAVREKLRGAKYPVYEADSEHPGGVIEVHEDGARVRGTWDFRRNVFVPRRSAGAGP